MTASQRLSSSIVVVASRRRTPRVAAGDQLDVEIVSVLVPANVRDIGFGGFSVETRCSLRIGAIHLFRFQTYRGRTLELRARVVHSCRKSSEPWEELYVSGCEFLYEPSVPTDQFVDELIDSATGVLSFETA
jgi:hypothetical protein